MPFIIAEVGSNWKTFDDLRISILGAKEAGADAVKFQCFSEASIYGYGMSTPALAYDWIPKLAAICEKQGIEFMCTAFDADTFRYIDKYVKRHKIASSEMRHVELLKLAVDSQKPFYVSVGGHDFNAIEKTVDQIKGSEFTLLYCCNAYPSKLHDLRVISELREMFNCEVGFSDHSIDIYTPFSAVEHYGATVLEKHVALTGMETEDSGHSITFKDFGAMVNRIHGKGPRHPNDQEKEAKSTHNRRIVVTQNINVGDALQYGRNFGIYRSKFPQDKYLDPAFFARVNNSRASIGLSQGEAIGADDFK